MSAIDEFRDLPGLVRRLVDDFLSAAKELEALRQERDGLRADAVRYRWLREKARTDECAPDGLYVGVDNYKFPGRWALYGKQADAAIDKAMAKEQGDGN